MQPKLVRLEYVGGGPKDGDVEYAPIVPLNDCVLLGPPGKRVLGLYFPVGHSPADPSTHRRDTVMEWMGERRFGHIDYGD